jgi:hypothetical protein
MGAQRPTAYTDDAPLPARTGCRAPDADLIRTTRPGRSSLRLVSSLDAATEIGTPTFAPPPGVARADEEARRRETRREAASDPIENRSDVFRALSV